MTCSPENDRNKSALVASHYAEMAGKEKRQSGEKDDQVCSKIVHTVFGIYYFKDVDQTKRFFF